MADDMFNHFADLGAALIEACEEVVEKVAFDAEGAVKAQIQANGQVDTGLMFNSVYVVTKEKTTYKGGEKVLPPVAKPPDGMEAYVCAGAEYSIYQNYGTSKLPARPFMEPGMDSVRDGVDAAMRAIEQKWQDVVS